MNRKIFFQFVKTKPNGPEKMKKRIAAMARDEEAAVWRELIQNMERRNPLH